VVPHVVNRSLVDLLSLFLLLLLQIIVIHPEVSKPLPKLYLGSIVPQSLLVHFLGLFFFFLLDEELDVLVLVEVVERVLLTNFPQEFFILLRIKVALRLLHFEDLGVQLNQVLLFC